MLHVKADCFVDAPDVGQKMKCALFPTQQVGKSFNACQLARLSGNKLFSNKIDPTLFVVGIADQLYQSLFGTQGKKLQKVGDIGQRQVALQATVDLFVNQGWYGLLRHGKTFT